MRVITINIGPTDVSGDATAYGDAVVLGAVYAVQLIDGDFDDYVDITITSEQESLSIPILTSANFNTDQIVYPRVLESLNTDASALTTHAMPLAVGRIKAVVAQGGDTKSGAAKLYIIE